MSYRRGLLGAALVILLFAFSLNAYACLVPIYGGAMTALGSACSSAHEQPARQFCDAFKTVGVQETTALFSPQNAPSPTVPEAIGADNLVPDLLLFSPVQNRPSPAPRLHPFVSSTVLRI